SKSLLKIFEGISEIAYLARFTTAAKPARSGAFRLIPAEIGRHVAQNPGNKQKTPRLSTGFSFLFALICIYKAKVIPTQSWRAVCPTHHKQRD
ncbi:hypothetical protein, partial [Amantichitinum ursilacus]|uniref:hypothetical protein n=1 Tax=Amantichitinum ursilacus TaxID=857265 RepID=UPI001F26C739